MIDSPSSDLESDESSCDNKCHRQESKDSMHNFIPSPVFAPVAIRADLEQANQGPSRPHEDAMDIVLQIVTFTFLKRAGPVRGKSLNKL